VNGAKPAIEALNDCLKYERTLQDCCQGYWLYFSRVRVHRLEKWFEWYHGAAMKRAQALELRVRWLDGTPSTDRYEYDVETVDLAEDIRKVFDYFDAMLNEARDQYEKSAGICKDSEDSVSAKLCGKNQEEIEDMLQRIEAKEWKVKVLGPVEYLAHHIHEEG